MKKLLSIFIITLLLVSQITNVNNTYANTIKVETKEEIVNWILVEYFYLFEKLYVLWSFWKEKELDNEMFKYIYKNYNDIDHILTSYDLLRETKTFDKYIDYRKDFLLVAKEIRGIDDYKKKIEKLKNLILFYKEWYNINKRVKKDFLPNHLIKDEQFQYLMKGIFENKKWQYFYKKIKETAIKIDEDPILAFTSIFTDQIRWIMSQRWYMKNIAKTYTPMLFTFTQFSYWKGWIKSFTWESIYRDSITYWYKDKVLWDIILPTIKDWKNDKEVEEYELAWKNILIDKDNEAIFPTILIKNIKTRWNNAWFNIDDNIWVIITLYNFWNNINKKPHWNPKVWGSIVVLNDYEYSFWWLWEAFYWYFKIYKEKDMSKF